MLAPTLLAFVLAATQAAPRPTLPPTPPGVAMRMSPLFAKATPTVRRWIDDEARKLRSLPPDGALVAADARQAFAAHTPPLTPGQADTLAAMALYQVLNDLDSEARLAIGDATAERIASLQTRRSKIVQTLSNILSKISKTDEAIVENLK